MGKFHRPTHHETFNTLKNQGYHFEHNFGHGYDHLNTVFAMLMMLAFLIDQLQQLCCPLFQKAVVRLKSKMRLWATWRRFCDDYLFEDWDEFLSAIAYGIKSQRPHINSS